MKWRSLIAGSLWTGGLLLVVLITAGALWVILSSVGDETGAAGVLGVALVALVCFVLDMLGLVVLLALAQLESAERPREETDRERD